MNISITLILVGITVLISYQAFNNIGMREKLLMWPAVVKSEKEWSRFLTSGFVHANWMHLGVNMYVLYIFGEQIEQVFILKQVFGPQMGRILFVVLYLGAIIVSSIPAFIKHQNNSYYRALGASGGTSAIVFAYIFFAPWAWFIFPPLPGILMGIAYLWYSSYMAKRGADNIGHDAHFAGAVFGFLFMIAVSVIYAPQLWESFLDKLLQGPSMP